MPCERKVEPMAAVTAPGRAAAQELHFVLGLHLDAVLYKTADSVLKQQLVVYDDVVKKKAADNPLFKEVLESQLEFARRATQWEQDTVVNRRMAFEHYFGPSGVAKKTAG